MLRRHFRHGGAIVWVHRDGRAVGGELVRRQGSSLERLVQALDGDWAGPRNEPSPQLAIGVACLELAVGAGLDRIGFGGAVPSLRDGVLRVKRAWGAAAHHWDANHRTLLIGWSEFGRVPRSFLHLNPLIFGAAGGLAAVAATAPGEPADLAAARLIWRRLIPRGIGRLFLVGAAGWSSHAPDGGTAAGGPIVLCPPCSSAELVAAATATRLVEPNGCRPGSCRIGRWRGDDAVVAPVDLLGMRHGERLEDPGEPRDHRCPGSHRRPWAAPARSG